MTIQEIFDLGIQMAMKADPRGEDVVKKLLKKANEKYKDLPEKKKKFFDKDNLTNPYSDSRIYYGDPTKPVKKLIAGIDVHPAELLLADRLNEKGAGIDLVIAHHPEVHALTALHEVMDLQIDVYGNIGVPINVAESLMTSRMGEVERRIRPVNYLQTLQTAELLDIPFMSLHTIWDNMSNNFMTNYLNGKEFDTVGEILDYLMELPEYQIATKYKAGPHIVSGSANSRPGKIGVFFTGGTNPSKEMYAEWAKAGIGTVIDMHMPEDALKEMKKMHVNVIDGGHMASDSIGANLFFDVLEKNGVEVVPFSGLIRVKRSK